ncbi:ATP phosphoribosyltransferase regulatory subunit [[Clostridium] aminophilum]|uniref:ATP phosphoribosyltransferase regulatory subunit n=1 Tax=[Clostridium] aminophilum TaxID=1526 RepID=A0A1I0I5A2_9FIRM|nr:ATP phosphoribosyltransferase regulatory subunit [[Clostridium] aminophilum]SET90930.1 ATP phosphoribosyltransferase regulatory subunit [[Clostridium] aminophilum]
MNSQKFNDLYRAYGYRKFKMSKFEPYDLYSDYRDFLTSSQIITFSDLDGTLLALKPDVTLSIMKNNNGGEEKVYYNENVYRAKNHHYREIQQVGVECVGEIDAYCEAEILMLAAKSLSLISGRYVLRVSDAGFLQKFLAAMRLPKKTADQVLGLFSTRNGAGLEKLRAEGSISDAAAQQLREMMDLFLPMEQGIEAIRRYDIIGDTVRHLEEVAETLKAFGVIDNIYLDFSLVNSMDYYNKIIFQGAVPEIPYEILFGGRYDRLPQNMGKNVGAIGFAVYMDEIDNYISHRKKFDVDYLISYSGDGDTIARMASVSARLTAEGLSVRTVREDKRDAMQQKPRAKYELSLEEAEAEVAKL